MTTDKSEPQALPIRTKSPSAMDDASSADFDIVATYHRILAEDTELASSIAAIEAMIALLRHTTSSTIMETLEIVKAHADRLKASASNPIPLTAGTDLFQQYLLRSLKQPASSSSQYRSPGMPSTPTRKLTGGGISHHDSFDSTRAHLLRNSKIFAQRAKDARSVIAVRGARYVTPGCTVLTAGGSRLVKLLLLQAAEQRTKENGHPDFRVIYVLEDGCRTVPAVVEALRAKHVPVSMIREATLSAALSTGKVDVVFAGAEAVMQNGGILSRMGTNGLASLAAFHKKKFYVVAETHKFVRVFPLAQDDLGRCGVKQTVLDFTKESGLPGGETTTGKEGFVEPLVDYTPPALIQGIISEVGVLQPSAVYSMLADIYA